MALPGAVFDLQEFGEMALRVGAAFALAIPIGWEREVATRSAGLRTFPLVAIASCSYMLIAISIVGSEPDAHSRVLQGLMTGIGFIGGGAILKDQHSVTGTATAASLWMTSAIGVAAAWGLYPLAVLLTVLTLAILRLFKSDERRAEDARLTGHGTDRS